MAYTRRYANRRYAKKRNRPSYHPVKRYVKKDRSNLKWGRMVKDVAMLKGLINTEVKYLDQSRNGGVDGYWDIIASSTPAVPGPESAPPTPGYVRFMVDYPPLGDDFNQRNGRSIKLKSIQLKGTIRVPATGSERRGQARVMIIVDHQAQSGEDTDPVPILFELDNNGHYSMGSRINRQQNKRYSVLAVKKLNFSQNYFTHSLNIYKRLNDKVKFNGPNVQDFVDKAFHVVVFTDMLFPNVGAGDIIPNFLGQFETRICYIDN